MTIADQHGTEHLLRMAEIYVNGFDGAAFAAPSLIVNYVLEHHYLPPEPFQKAIVEFATFHGMPQP